MALSTIIPMAIIKAPRDTRCRSMPHIDMMIKLARMANIRPVTPITIATRTPILKARITSTMTTACIRLTMKPLIDSSTRSDCHEMRCSSIPTGSDACSSSIRLSISLPTLTTFVPEAGAMGKPMAGKPLIRITCNCGSI